jgi:hypothetical protein
MSSTAKEFSHFRAVEQVQQSLQGAPVVRLVGKSASIKSSSECIHFSNAISFSICFLPFFSCSVSFSSCFSRISLSGSRRQLSIRKNERKGDNDEPDTPLLLDRELAVGEGDVVIGRKQSNQANNTANDGLEQGQGLAIEPEPPPGRRCIQIPKSPSTLSSPARFRSSPA